MLSASSNRYKLEANGLWMLLQLDYSPSIWLHCSESAVGWENSRVERAGFVDDPGIAVCLIRLSATSLSGSCRTSPWHISLVLDCSLLVPGNVSLLDFP